MALLTLAVLSLCLFAGVRAQFPMSCQTNITERVGVCCPKPNGHIHACGYPSRGICDDLPETNINYYPRVPDHVDTDRRNWPHAYVQKGCRCYGNFYGPDCSECKFGWTGKGCNVKEKPRERRNVLSLTAQEKRIFQDTILRAKYIPSGLGAVLPPFNATEEIRMVELSIYDMYIWIHYRTSHRPIGQCRESFSSYNYAHGGPHFPLWHRRYMLWVEKKLRSVSEDHHFTLPYWDWVAASNCTVCTNDLVGANNLTHPTGGLETDAPFHDFDLICPRIEYSSRMECGTCDPTTSKGKLTRGYPDYVALFNYTYPSVNQVKITLSREEYELLNPEQDVPPGDGLPRDFSGALESVHNTVHNIQSGSMSGLLTSPTDPIFILHHTFIDKLLEVWFKTHDIKDQQYPYTSYPLGEGAEEPIVGFFGPVDRIIDYFDYAEGFGYTYDTHCLSYEDGVECKNLDGGQTSSTHPTPRSTETTTTTTKPTTRPPTTPSTTTIPDQETGDRELWKGLAISSFAISILLLIILGIAVILSLRSKSKRQNPYQLDSTSDYKSASNGSSKSNGIVNVAYDKQGDYKEKF